jgi:Phage integrase, N-terminal SAM-like domain
MDRNRSGPPKTLERYSELCERRIIPHFGATLLQKLSLEDVQQWHSTLVSGPRPLRGEQSSRARRDGLEKRVSYRLSGPH